MKFEKVSKYAETDIAMPERKTKYSAGYDMVAAEDYVIPPLSDRVELVKFATSFKENSELFDIIFNSKISDEKVYELNEVADLIKQSKARPTLVSTGMKCQLDPGYYLELSVRSSSPLKYLLVLANGVGIIDADYYNNPDNEGEIFFQILNLSPLPIKIKKGEAIGQGIIKKYYLTDDDTSDKERVGGFGSTTK